MKVQIMRTLEDLLDSTELVKVKRPAKAPAKKVEKPASEKKPVRPEDSNPPFKIGNCVITLDAFRFMEKVHMTADKFLQKHLFPEFANSYEAAVEGGAIHCCEEIEHVYRYPLHSDSLLKVDGISVVTNSERTLTVIRTLKDCRNR